MEIKQHNISNEDVNIRDICKIIAKFWYVIALFLTLSLCAGLLKASKIKNTYRTEITLKIGYFGKSLTTYDGVALHFFDRPADLAKFIPLKYKHLAHVNGKVPDGATTLITLFIDMPEKGVGKEGLNKIVDHILEDHLKIYKKIEDVKNSELSNLKKRLVLLEKNSSNNLKDKQMVFRVQDKITNIENSLLPNNFQKTQIMGDTYEKIIVSSKARVILLSIAIGLILPIFILIFLYSIEAINYE